MNINGVMISADVLYTLKELDNVTIQSLIQSREEIDYNILVKKLDLKNRLRELEEQKLEDERKLLEAEEKKKSTKNNRNKRKTTKKGNKLKVRATKKEVSEILEMFEEGSTVSKISKVMGITKERVQKAVDTGK